MLGPVVSAKIAKMDLKTRILAFSAFSDEDYIIEILKAKAQGYVFSEQPDLFLDGTRSVAKGETWLSPTIAR
jgi:DNA-binding NarL/FixJ family response regulator